MTEDDYINAIKCSLNRTTILLERKPVDIWINSFSHHILGAWNAIDCGISGCIEIEVVGKGKHVTT